MMVSQPSGPAGRPRVPAAAAAFSDAWRAMVRAASSGIGLFVISVLGMRAIAPVIVSTIFLAKPSESGLAGSSLIWAHQTRGCRGSQVVIDRMENHVFFTSRDRPAALV